MIKNMPLSEAPRRLTDEHGEEGRWKCHPAEWVEISNINICFRPAANKQPILCWGIANIIKGSDLFPINMYGERAVFHKYIASETQRQSRCRCQRRGWGQRDEVMGRFNTTVSLTTDVPGMVLCGGCWESCWVCCTLYTYCLQVWTHK